MDEKLLKVLEFDEIRARLAKFAVSSRAKDEISRMLPLCEYKEVERNLRLTEEAYIAKYKYSANPISEFDDVSEILDKAKAGAVLRPGELLKAANIMRCARIAKSELSELGDDVSELKALVAALIPDRNFEKQIGDAVASENELKDDASEKLRDLRRKIHSANAKLKEKLASYTRNGNLSKYLQDNIVTVRLGRFVLPVKSECRSMVPGLIHDQSGSGSTVFIEPFAVVELNNELKYLQMEEQLEIERILSELSLCVAERSDMLEFALDRCTVLDVVFAKCAYSVSINGTMPVLDNGKKLSLKNARHPLIDPHKVVPVSVEVGEQYDILVITGPNTGGKTVCLKTVGLCCLMAYSGIWIPCDKNSVVSVYDNIFCDLGDEQSIEQSLSTFSAHIVNVVKITDGISPRSLVLLDELGSGTDPVEGAALSIGILKYFEIVGCKGIVTTHFNELKEYALVSEKLMNACMQFDEETLKPTYKLMVGVPGVSNALKIAGTLGLNEYILDKAKESISDEQIRFETVLRQAQYAKMQAEKQKEEIEAEKRMLEEERVHIETARKKIEEKQERIQNNAKAETARLISNMVAKASELLDELKDTVKEADEEALRKARQLFSKLERVKNENEERLNPEYADFVAASAKVGQKVIVRSLGGEGVLLSLADKKGLYRVRAGNMQISVKADDLAQPFAARQESKPKEKVKRAVLSAPAEPSAAEIKLLGMTVAEAIEAIEPLILSSSSGTIIRIVHGKGTGALGKGIQAYLKTRSDIASYRYGRYGEGDTGVTLAEIK
ncbi:endonuclease MutS2 [Pumilibacter intestinalis]|uniref:endonuclease MutS2 n=1 Tax=Pumilibacter intestinalis TaxID=2941511 RepID=UPI00203C8C94|nr:endonuclease MutS2 [Pumilibacter intestinalis]